MCSKHIGPQHLLTGSGLMEGLSHQRLTWLFLILKPKTTCPPGLEFTVSLRRRERGLADLKPSLVPSKIHERPPQRLCAWLHGQVAAVVRARTAVATSSAPWVSPVCFPLCQNFQTMHGLASSEHAHLGVTDFPRHWDHRRLPGAVHWDTELHWTFVCGG